MLGIAKGRSWAERVAAPVAHLGELPESVTDGDAAGLPVAGLTAKRTLAAAGPLAGRSVLVTGAAGGVGRFAVQLAALAGAQVIAVAEGDRATGLKALGAERVVADVDEVEGPVDVALESAGGASLSRVLELVAPAGVVVSFGTSSEQPSTIPPFWFGSRHRARLEGFNLFADLRRSEAGSDLADLAELVAHGKLSPQIGMQRSWREAGAVLRSVLDREVAGKAVLLID